MENKVKICVFHYNEKRYVQVTDIEGIEIEVKGRVDYVRNGSENEKIISQVSIKSVGFVDGIRFEHLLSYAQQRAEEIVSQAFDDQINFQILGRRMLDETDAAEERLNQWYRNKFGKDRK